MCGGNICVETTDLIDLKLCSSSQAPSALRSLRKLVSMSSLVALLMSSLSA